MRVCIECGKEIKRSAAKYCSNACQSVRQYKKYIDAWKRGEVNGERGLRAKNISRHLKRYLFETRGEQCELCGWKQLHAVTGHVPLEIDHIDGNAENNKEVNLRLLCPNCHSLTFNFKNLNKSNGRTWRRSLYKKSSE